eukprot:CAMPEP_0206145266 /NCGR_PEP_ID=MMETSP1473-20131121/26850_1 /ASSEMBLY_ACC=CAM_ASM_001109 /TAXON_ID=1461547 /ORGANISM="Stichococcus sp, Strain RCC1054" /LENGTH=110 /DNA_ID=CAMNT_0053541411 /DNA_START=99 /DNA_END=432 /DNA_ORIENTATION=+
MAAHVRETSQFCLQRRSIPDAGVCTECLEPPSHTRLMPPNSAAAATTTSRRSPAAMRAATLAAKVRHAQESNSCASESCWAMLGCLRGCDAACCHPPCGSCSSDARTPKQ